MNPSSKIWKLLGYIFSGLILCSFFCFFMLKKWNREDSSSNLEHIKTKYGSLFIPLSVEKFSSIGLPCFMLQVNRQNVTVELDLGFKRDGAFSKEFLDLIDQKIFVKTVEIYGFRGNSYKENLFKIPSLQMGQISFQNVEILESGDLFEKDAAIMEEGTTFTPTRTGRIGWGLFKNSNLFLDLSNSKIAICDSLSTLEKHNYPVGNFVQAPLLLDRGIIEFYALTDEGPLRCMLDTGSTWNLINQEVEEATIEEAVKNPNHVFTMPSFTIEHKEFQQIVFHALPLRYPIKIEAVLGMDFFRKHLVFIDFTENLIYFSPA